MKANFDLVNACVDLTVPWVVSSQSPPLRIPTYPLRSFGTPGKRIHAERGLSRRFLLLAIAYMDEHVGENFTLEELARAVGISRFHFSRLFRMSTGTSPMVFALHLRVEHAKAMLLRGDRRASEVAMALGFFDQSHFSRTFRRMTGLSPGEYVRLCEATGVAA